MNIKHILNDICELIRKAELTGTVTYRGEHSHLIRCGCNRISANTSEFLQNINIEIQKGKKSISGSICLTEAAEKAPDFIKSLAEKLQFMPDNEFLPEVEPLTEAANSASLDNDYPFDSKVAVKLYEAVISEFKSVGEVSGAFSAGLSEYAVANTASDHINSAATTDFSTEVVVFLFDESKEIRSADCGNDLSQFTYDNVLNQLRNALKIKQTTLRIDLEPGEYDIVFHADAFGQMSSFLNWVMFSGEGKELGSSMLNQDENIGSKIFGENITIFDNPNSTEALYPRTVGLNGVERGEFPLVTDGVLTNLYYSNKKMCKRFDKVVNNDAGVGSLAVAAGDGPSDFESMVKSCTKPTIFVSFIHYMNLTNPTLGEFTGVSRFGTFLVEDGEVTAHYYNLRINDSLRRIFNNVEWLSSATQGVDLSHTYYRRKPSGIITPKFVKVSNVNITATSKEI